MYLFVPCLCEELVWFVIGEGGGCVVVWQGGVAKGMNGCMGSKRAS